MSAAPGATADTWCPRCDDLAAVAPGTPCATCAAPRLLIDQPRPRTRPAAGHRNRPASRARTRPAAGGRTWHAAVGAPPGASGHSWNGSGPGAAGEDLAGGEVQADGGVLGDGEAVRPSSAGAAAEAQAGGSATGAADGGEVPPHSGVGDGVAGAPEGPATVVRPVGGWRGSARPSRWLVVGVVGAGVVLVGLGRLLPSVPVGARPGQAAAAASQPRARPQVVLPTARPRVALPGRGPMLGRGASGWMVVEYDGWLWRQPLGGGAPHPVARLPQGATRVSLSPRGDRLVLVRSSRFHSWQTRVEVRSLVGGVLQEGATGSGPVWSSDGRLAFVTAGEGGWVGTSPSRSRHPSGPELHLVGAGKVEVLVLPRGLHGAKLGWSGDGHPVLLAPDPRSGLFEVEHGHVRRVLPAGHATLARGRDGALTTGLLRPRDAAGPLGAQLVSVPSSLAVLAPDGRRVALVTGPAEQPKLEVRAAGRRTTSGLPADRYRSLHWSPGGNFVWVQGEQAVFAVEVASGRVVGAGPALPGNAAVLGFTS